MICPNCQAPEQNGKFCEKCGAKLPANNAPEVIQQSEGTNQPIPQQKPDLPGNQTPVSKEKPYLMASKQYFRFFADVIKRPFDRSKSIGEKHFLYGLISMFLYALLIPFILYIWFGRFANEFGMMVGTEAGYTFINFILKPILAFLIFIFLMAVFTYASVRLSHVNVSFKAMIARFGAYLIPFICLLAIVLVMALLGITLSVPLLLLAFIGTLTIVPALVIFSFKQTNSEGLDIFYGTVLTLALSFFALAIMGDILFQTILNFISDYIGSMNMFHF